MKKALLAFAIVGAIALVSTGARWLYNNVHDSGEKSATTGPF